MFTLSKACVILISIRQLSEYSFSIVYGLLMSQPHNFTSTFVISKEGDDFRVRFSLYFCNISDSDHKLQEISEK